jgi:glucan phosphoethanolaminetransferase (alkaline phosphatase superfamily)
MQRYLKEILLALYLLLHSDYYIARVEELGWSFSLAVYSVMFVVLTLVLLCASYIGNTVLRYTFAVLFFLSAVFLQVYMSVTADYMTYSSFISLIYSGAFIDDAFYHYHSSILLSVVLGAPLLVGIALKPRRRLPVKEYALLGAPLAGIISLTGLVAARGGAGARGLPEMYTPLVYANLFAFETATSKIGPRQAVSLPHDGRRLSNDIVLIVDESVSGSYLDINAEHGVHSNLKHSPHGATIHNYGFAASITNCSVDTNITLRFGGTRSDYQRINLTMPSIWQYAKRAGLRTVYIDSQRTGGNLQNLMSKAERQEIDEFVQFDSTAVRNRDMAAAVKLIELLNNDVAELVIVNKVGAHFPVADKYPDDFMQYHPALQRGTGMYADVSDTGSRDGFSGELDDWVRYRNSYRNTLLWNVGEFFTRLFAQARLDNAVLIYTSDHGQDLHERGNPGLNTHCSSDPEIEEGVVPLVLIQGNSAKSIDWGRELLANRNRSSHYNIFPTLLQLMGYDLGPLQAVYGKPLSLRTGDDFTFNTRFNARLGVKPNWKRIELDAIVLPNAHEGVAAPAVTAPHALSSQKQ